MTDKNWEVMNDVQEAFDQITTFNFLLEQLQEAVNENHPKKIIDITAALNSFYTPFCNNWDDKFKKAWEVVVKEQ